MAGRREELGEVEEENGDGTMCRGQGTVASEVSRTPN